MIRHTILTAFSRPQNATIYANLLRGKSLEWRPLCSQLDIKGNHYPSPTGPKFPEESWIKPWLKEMPTKLVDRSNGGHATVPTVNPGNWLVDRFLDEKLQEDGGGTNAATYGKPFFGADHFLTILNDDCLWSRGHWEKMQAAMQPVDWTRVGADSKLIGRCREKGWPDVEPPHAIFCAYKMGGNECPATYKRVKSWDDWKYNSLRLFVTKSEVMTVRADVMKGIRFGDVWCADGMIVEQLCDEHEGRIALVNHSFIMPNALDPAACGFPHHER